MRARLLLSLVLLGLPVACGSNTQFGGGDPGDDCGAQPNLACVDPCGGGATLPPSCVDGSWVCSGFAQVVCDECGPIPEGYDCIDACGNFTTPICLDGGWTCDDPGECPPDDPPPSDAKTAEWSVSFGGDDYENVERVALDGEGNVYVAANFRDALFVGGASYMSTGGYDTAVTKYDPEGKHLWTQLFTGVGDELPHGLELHADGSLLLLLSSSDVNTQNPPKSGPASLLRLSTEDGATLSTQPLGLNLGNFGTTHLAVQPGQGGMIVLGGSFSGDLTFDGVTISDEGQGDGYLLALDATGSLLWAQAIGGGSYDYLVGLDVDEAGNVFASGAFKAAMAIDGIYLEPQDGFDGFVLAFSADGDGQWGATLASSGSAVIGDVAAYGDGGVVLTGTFEGSGSVGTASHAASSEDPEALVARLGPMGEPIFSRVQGAARPGGSLARHRGWHVVMDDSGDIMLAGSPVDAEPNPDESTSIVVARLDPQTGMPTGENRWSAIYGDTNSNKAGDVVCRDGRLALVGEFFGGMNFGNGPLGGNIQGAGFLALFTTDAPPVDEPDAP